MKENILQICHCFLIIVLLFSGKTTSQFYFFGIEWTIRLWKWNVPLSGIGSFHPISHDSKVSRIGFKMVSSTLEVIWLVRPLKGVTILCTVCWAVLGTGCCTDRRKRIVQVPVWVHARRQKTDAPAQRQTARILSNADLFIPCRLSTD